MTQKQFSCVAVLVFNAFYCQTAQRTFTYWKLTWLDKYTINYNSDSDL